MSGSSLDGADLAYCEFFRESSNWEYRIIKAETTPYPTELKNRLENASSWPMNEILLLDRELGHYYGRLLLDFHRRYQLEPSLIASHGHTILHDPAHGITFQAGCGEVIADITGTQVINDFRKEDVNQGGQGAPLVPVGDRLLFGDYEACINLGGFANISYENSQGLRLAYDICPANMPLNWLAGLAGLAYDKNGENAKSGRINQELLEGLNQLKYYSEPPPKSLGREWYLEEFFPVINQLSFKIPDLLATIVEHIAIQVGNALKVMDGGPFQARRKILLTGGGALNTFLVQRIMNQTNSELFIPDKALVNYKEAMVFAFLGLLRSLNEINCFASVTGGKHDLSTGVIHIPK